MRANSYFMSLNMIYHLSVFKGGVQVSIAAVKNERNFYHSLTKAIYDKLVGVIFTMKIYDGGVVIDGSNISEKFLGSVIPFVYQNQVLELRVYPETL